MPIKGGRYVQVTVIAVLSTVYCFRNYSRLSLVRTQGTVYIKKVSLGINKALRGTETMFIQTSLLILIL